jgi:hypothetical protein
MDCLASPATLRSLHRLHGKVSLTHNPSLQISRSPSAEPGGTNVAEATKTSKVLFLRIYSKKKITRVNSDYSL